MVEENMTTSPRHVAVIMDGNGRWGENRKRSRTFGHKAGTEVVRKIVQAALANGISFLTLYAFSSENWNRRGYEVRAIMRLFHSYTEKEAQALAKAGVAVRFIGDRSRLAPTLQKSMENMEKVTALGDKMLLQICISYGGRDEIVRAVNKLRRADFGADDDFSELDITNALDTHGTPDVDLVIRTGGERRLSNFLIWQTIYAELCFRDELWPDYTEEMFAADLAWYNSRQRRFGQEKSKMAAE